MYQYYAKAVRDDGADAGWGKFMDASSDEAAYDYAFQLMTEEAGVFDATRIELYRMARINTIHVGETHL